ncbi:MAG: alpha-E domain-containing protein, partial [Spongiibacteraceae bacterium]
MLSRVAERVYWFARYLERVENTARLLNVYTSLLLDLPGETGISWYNLIIASGTRSAFDKRFQNRDERNVVKYLLSDEENTSSMLSSISMMRENIRTTRDVVPPESWELVNELSIYFDDNMQQGINRRNRRQFLEEVIKCCQQINGLISGTMSHDAAWQMLRLGRNLERADMTSRIVEAGAQMLPEMAEEEYSYVIDVVWGSVLRSLNAYQPYRRTMKVAVTGEDVVSFLQADKHFPRSIAYCLRNMRESAEQ